MVKANSNKNSEVDQPNTKIFSLDDAAKFASRLRKNSLHIVMAHGCFDLLHVGHVKHLQFARRQGDVLIVTVTADQFVNKGPNRPVFNEHMRAEMLAALSCVDAVAIAYSKDAVKCLERIKPHIYVKGSDYKNSEDDLTGRIVAEVATVENAGGRVVFTDEVVFSSSQLINSELNIFESKTKQFISEISNRHKTSEILNAVEKIKDYRVLFIGDTIIDEYQYVVPMGKSPKENMIASLYQGHDVFAGGVIAAANHLSSFCKDINIITILGSELSYLNEIQASLKWNVRLNPIFRPNTPTTHKCRFIDQGYSVRKLFEVYTMDDTPLDGKCLQDVIEKVSDVISDYDVVIVTDFGHGLMTPELIELVRLKSKFLAVNAQSNSANYGFNLITKYSSANYVCIDGPEAKLALGEKHLSDEVIAGELLPKQINCDNVAITRGKNGSVFYQDKSGVHTSPSLTNTIIDTVGAGDAFFAITAPFVAAGVSADIIGLFGNLAGAMKVNIVGHSKSLDKLSFQRALTTILK